LPYRAHFAKTVGYPLGYPALDAERFGQMAGVKRFGERALNQPAQIGGRG
jgi:hypothetical protein